MLRRYVFHVHPSELNYAVGRCFSSTYVCRYLTLYRYLPSTDFCRYLPSKYVFPSTDNLPSKDVIVYRCHRCLPSTDICPVQMFADICPVNMFSPVQVFVQKRYLQMPQMFAQYRGRVGNLLLLICSPIILLCGLAQFSLNYWHTG